jgi:predicted metal-dependent enzyme (double-stranded beta helix superfamily)
MMRTVEPGPTTAGLVAVVGTAGADWAPRIARFLADHEGPFTAEIAAATGRLDEARYADLLSVSREVSTHYKWLLAAGDDDAWKIWLHQYKDEKVAAGAYADVPHDHRYNFVSLVLAGGYDNVTYTRGEEALRPAGETPIGRGGTVALDHREIHSLAAIRPGTLSLFVQGQIRKQSSSSYRTDGTTQEHPSLEQVFGELRSQLNESR